MANEQWSVIKLLGFCFASVCLLEIYQTSGIECGTKDITRPLVKNGDHILRGEWPFIVGIYQFGQSEPFCGGTLISIKHVLTAAHCIQGKYTLKKVVPSDLVVYIGAYDLTAEDGVSKRNVGEIYVHPEWDVYDDRYDADIAILDLSDTVNFTHSIRPICLPSDDFNIDGANINANGVVLGWGWAENNTMEQIARQTVTKALNDSYCFGMDNSMAYITSARTFCGGDGQGVPHFGDSGGGFFVFSGLAWEQYGIISAIRTNSIGHVTVKSLAVYTNVKLFKQWIIETVRESGSEVASPIGMDETKIHLHCEFGYRNSTYGCFIDGLDIRSDNIEVSSITGSHLKGKTDLDIELITFRSGTMFYLPDNLGKIFKNVKIVEVGHIGSSTLNTKLIRRSNFRSLEGLVELKVLKNQIEPLEEDTLWDLPRLQHFELKESKLSKINEKTFERNGNLKDICLQSNQLELIQGNLFRNNFLLENISLWGNSITAIDEVTFANNAKLKNVSLNSNQLESLPVKILQNNFFLESVDVSNNLLDEIDGKLFAYNSKLREVKLSTNMLEFIPVELFRNNFLLERVDLSNNSLEMIDEVTFANNTKLKDVYLYSNRLEIVPRRLFGNNFLLERIQLDQNNLKAIDEVTFLNNSELRDVWLESNHLESIPANIFLNNTKLVAVNFKSNNLEFLPETLFHNNLLLELVDFSKNRLKVININFTRFKNIKLFIFYTNPCFDGYYDSSDNPLGYRNEFLNLTEFQNIIRDNCSEKL